MLKSFLSWFGKVSESIPVLGSSVVPIIPGQRWLVRGIGLVKINTYDYGVHINRVSFWTPGPPGLRTIEGTTREFFLASAVLASDEEWDSFQRWKRLQSKGDQVFSNSRTQK